MFNRQYANPMIVRGLKQDGKFETASSLLRVQSNDRQRKEPAIFNEKWFQELLFTFPSLLRASEIEEAFEALQPIATELRVGPNYLDLLFVNPSGCIALVETKLFRNPEAKRQVVAQAIEYACGMAQWTYADFIHAIKQTTKSVKNDPLIEIMRDFLRDDTSFDENRFIQSVTRNLRQGKFLILIVGDEVSREVESMAEYLQSTPHLHYTLGLVEIALFQQSENSLDPLFVQPRVVAKTVLHTRAVIDIRVPENFLMKSAIASEPSPEKNTILRNTVLTEELFLDALKGSSPEAAHEVATWALANAPDHRLQVVWQGAGPSFKYRDEQSEMDFNFGQISKSGELRTGMLLPRFKGLGLPVEIALDYLDDLVKLVPGAHRKEYGWDKTMKTEAAVFGQHEGLPLRSLALDKEKWFEAIDRAIARLKAIREAEQK